MSGFFVQIVLHISLKSITLSMLLILLFMAKKWLETEKLVHLIESSLNKDSEVLHNQQLPVINCPTGRTRQCDIVIVSGNISRKTTTIVEVQNRKSKVDINTFIGWLGKMEEVGAQHLICVSMKPFPKSIIEKAKQKGNSVLLINLNDNNEISKIPPNILMSKSSFHNFDIHEIFELTLGLNQKELDQYGIKESDIKLDHFTANTKAFSFDKKTIFSIHEISLEVIKSLEYKVNEVFEIIYTEEQDLYLYFNDFFLKLREFSVKIKWSNTVREMIPTIISYEQIGDGVLAWVVDFNYKEDDKYINVKATFVVKGDKIEINLMSPVSNIDLISGFEIKSM